MPMSHEQGASAISLIALSFCAEDDVYPKFREWAIRTAAECQDEFAKAWLKEMKAEFLPLLGSWLVAKAWPGHLPEAWSDVIPPFREEGDDQQVP